MFRLMSGRYGWDALGTLLFFTGLILDIIGLAIGNSWLPMIADILLLYEIFRMFSKNIYARQKENTWFLNTTRKPRHHWQAFQKGRKDKANKYYVCPKCGQIVRIPKGHGKVEISCPKCKSVFTRKS